MPPLKRSSPFLESSGNPPSKALRLDAKLPVLDQGPEPRGSREQLSGRDATPTEPRNDGTSTSAKPTELSNLAGQQDTHLTLGQIHNGDPAVLINQMLEIQKATVPRDESEEWANDLRFLHVEKLGPRGQLRHIPLTRKGEYQYHVDYVAVSYRWQFPSDPEPNPAYLIIDGDERPRGNSAPNTVLNRAIAYAQDNNIPFIWIDQECIPNREGHPEEHNIAIQAMDIVYRRSNYPLGLLKRTLRRDQFKLLRQLLRKRIHIDQKTHVERWEVAPSKQDILSIRDILTEILADDWWERAWIFQEEYCGSSKMKVGLPYNPLNEYSHNRDSLGDFYLRPVQFRKMVTLFRPDLERFGSEFGRLLDKAKRYSILNKTGAEEGGSVPQFKTMSTDIISDIDGGGCEHAMDRLAIIANCCHYSRRLDCRRLSDVYNLSTCLLTLFLLNGELLRYPVRKSESPTRMTVSHSSSNIHDFLKAYSLTFTPPVFARQLTFIQNCRLPSVSLTLDGIETSGWVWDMTGPSLSVQLPKYFAPHFRHEPNLKDLHEPFLRLVYEELKRQGHQRFTMQIHDFSWREENGPNPELLSSDSFKEQMVDALLVAVNEGKSLRLALLSGETEPSAIFIDPSTTGREAQTPTKVFTSWCPRKSEYHVPNFVSILVQADGTSSKGYKRVRTSEWINGLWFATRKDSFETVVFPWPF